MSAVKKTSTRTKNKQTKNKMIGYPARTKLFVVVVAFNSLNDLVLLEGHW